MAGSDSGQILGRDQLLEASSPCSQEVQRDAAGKFSEVEWGVLWTSASEGTGGSAPPKQSRHYPLVVRIEEEEEEEEEEEVDWPLDEVEIEEARWPLDEVEIDAS